MTADELEFLANDDSSPERHEFMRSIFANHRHDFIRLIRASEKVNRWVNLEIKRFPAKELREALAPFKE